ncbi:MAG: hypothetical protein FJ033_05330, partial [Chloroflexi bacterium]|nr:hypothetical protein [Chloroflexota bacterium]
MRERSRGARRTAGTQSARRPVSSLLGTRLPRDLSPLSDLRRDPHDGTAVRAGRTPPRLLPDLTARAGAPRHAALPARRALAHDDGATGDTVVARPALLLDHRGGVSKVSVDARITRVTAVAESRPRAQPVRDALQTLDTSGVCTVEVETDIGICGRGQIGFGRLGSAPDLMARVVTDLLGPEIVGQDPFLVRAIRDRLWRLTDYHGSTGLTLMGVSGIDIALWDFIGRALGAP